jgi:hypothetical protein
MRTPFASHSYEANLKFAIKVLPSYDGWKSKSSGSSEAKISDEFTTIKMR